MSTTSTTLFTGSSRYSNDFKAVIQRAVDIATLPITQYKSQQTTLNAESSELSTLSGSFSALQSALTSLSTATTGAKKSAISSNTSVLNATAATGATAATYTLDVTNAGSSASSLSASSGLGKVTDPSVGGLTSSSSFTLTEITDPGTPQAATGTFTFSTAGTSLNELRDKINAQSGANVQATVVNVGSGDAPDYRLSIQSTKLAAQQIQLNDGSQDLLSYQAPGAKVQYKLNGSTEQFSSDSRTLSLSPGLTVNILSASSGVPVTLTVSNDSSKVNSALSGIALAYNAAVDELDKNRGQAGGALSGNSIVNALSSTLQNLSFYDNGSTSLASLGLTLGKDGHLTLDQTAFSAAMQNPDAVQQFLGSSSSGFIAAAQSLLNGVTGANGTLTSASQITQDDLKQQQQLIDDTQARVDRMQTDLQAQMSAADSLIAQLEQQATYITDMFQAMAQYAKTQ